MISRQGIESTDPIGHAGTPQIGSRFTIITITKNPTVKVEYKQRIYVEMDIQDMEQKLWQAADKLRNDMDSAEYEHIVLGLIF